MEALASPAIAAVLTVIGTGLLQRAREYRRERATAGAHLAASLAAFGSALDCLILEIEQLPAMSRPRARAWTALERRAPAFDFLIGRLARALFGKQLFRAIEDLQVATNQLMLTAPESALESLRPIFDRLAGYEERNHDWLAALRGEREEFAYLSRQLVGPDAR